MVTDSENEKRPDLTEIATSRDGRDITKGYVDSLPYVSPTDRVLHQAGGYAAYEELLRDDQVAACFSQRRNAVISRPWCVTPGGTRRQDKAAAALVEETLKRLDWDTTTDQMLYARHYGYAVAEILWRIKSGQVCASDIRVRDRRRFVFAPDNALLMQTTTNPNGERLPARKFWLASVGASHADEPYGLGLAQALHWPVWFKRNGARFWATYLEKFGAPTAVGHFPNGSSKAEQTKLLSAVRAVATDSGLILPEGVQIDLLEASRGGEASYETWMNYWDAAIAKIILGQTMTTDDGASYAQATVHYDVRQDLVKADADLVCQSANNSWVRWLVDYNLPGAAYPQVWRDMEDAEDTAQRATRDKNLFDMGYRLTPKAVTSVYGDDYEPIPATSPAAVPTSETKEPPANALPKEERQIGFKIPQLAEPTAPQTPLILAEEDDFIDPVGPMATRLEQESTGAWDDIMGYVRQLVNDAPDMLALRDALLNAFEGLPIERLGNVMSLALSAAELSGRYDVEQESERG